MVKAPPEVLSQLTGRGNGSMGKLKDRTHATIEIQHCGGGEGSTSEVLISGNSIGVAAAKREV